MINKNISQLFNHEEFWKNRLSYHYNIDKNIETKTFKETYIIYYKFFNHIQKLKQAVSAIDYFNLEEFSQYIEYGISKSLIFDKIFESFYTERYSNMYDDSLNYLITNHLLDDDEFIRCNKLYNLFQFIKTKQLTNHGFPGLCDLLDLLEDFIDRFCDFFDDEDDY